MYVESLQITSFGALSGFTLDLDDGINVVHGKNEAGKSTVAEFIRYVFYGFNSKADRERHQSFNSEVTAGSVILRDGEKRYRIERRTAGTKDTCHVYDLDSGSPCFEGKAPGEVFFGMPAGLFESSAFVGQTGGSRIDGQSTSELLDNLLFAADEGVNVKKSLKRLDDVRVSLLHKNKKGGQIYELTSALTELEGRYDRAKENGEEILSLENKIRDYEGKLDYEEKRRDALKGQLDDYRLQRWRERKQRLSDLENRYNELQNALTEHEAKYTRNDFFPDQAYLESLKECASQVLNCDERIAAVQKRLENLEREMERDRAERERAQREINAKRSAVSAKRSVAVAVAVICCICSIVGTALSAWMFLLQNMGAGIGIGAMSMLLFGCMIGGFVLVNRYSLEIKELDSQALDRDDGFSVRLDIIRDELAERKAERDRYSGSLNDLCSRWNMKYSRDAIAEMMTVIDDHKALDRDTDVARSAYVQMKSETEGMLADEPEDDGRELHVPDDFDFRATERNLSIVENMIKIKNDGLKGFEIQHASLTASSEQPTELLEEVRRVRTRIAELEDRYDAFTLAAEKIVSASEKMRASVSPTLANGAGKRMESLTDGRYGEIGVDSRFALSFRPESGGGSVTKGEEYMSAGTADVAYVSLRLALSELMSAGGNRPPMIFDESFARLDDERLLSMLRILRGETGQSVILTSNVRELELLNKNSIPHKEIRI